MIHNYAAWFWAAILLFYLSDNFILIEESEMLIVESPLLAYSFVFQGTPFFVRKKVLCFANFASPWTFAFKFSWFNPDTPNWTALDLRDEIDQWRNRRIVLRVISTLAACNLFLIGPILTYLSGYITAVLVSGSAHLSLTCFLAVFQWKVTYPQNSLSQAMLASLEYLVCPGYLPNVCKRVARLRSTQTVDGGLYILLFASSGRGRALKGEIVTRLEDVMAVTQPDDGSYQRAIQYRQRLAL